MQLSISIIHFQVRVATVMQLYDFIIRFQAELNHSARGWELWSAEDVETTETDSGEGIL